MTESESSFPCAVITGREAAEATAARLAAAGIETVVVPPGPRFHRLPADTWELRVPATQAARARAILAD